MELFTKLFGSLLVFVYHCFDRIVIHGYLSGLSRPEQVVYFFRRPECVNNFETPIAGSLVSNAALPRVRAASVSED